ncbi:MAG: class I SAM-dependent methyltransferase [Candidatus Dormibacteria bacterium]
MTAQDYWTESLAEWALPPEILAQGEESPWALPPWAFAESARLALSRPLTPTHRFALEVLPQGGHVLDVGAGAGAASLPLAERAGEIVAVDQSQEMLREFSGLAADRVPVVTIEGIWPEVARMVAVADVVVCANVAYNVPALGDFVVALTQKAREKVVMELTGAHPQASLNWLWKHFWDLDRPEVPTADDAAAVVREATGLEVAVVAWPGREPLADRFGDEGIAWIRRRLCLPASRDEELAQLLRSHEPPARSAMVTLAWAGRGPGGASSVRR